MINSKGFTIGDTTYRALEAQVQKNKEDIAEHKRVTQVLADWGIKVIGVISDPANLPDPLTYAGEYGDAYAVGATEPYDYYIFTRPDPNSGHPDNFWLNVGGLTVQGPRGPQGPKGDTGAAGKNDKWYVSYADPPSSLGAEYTLALNLSNANILTRNVSGGWSISTNIKGAQGIQGPQGPQGVPGARGPQGAKGDTGIPGSAVNIIDILSSVEDLPNPTTVARDAAYLIGDNIYIITGTGTDLVWKNAGIFSGGGSTIVNSVGTPLSTVNIDDYIQKPDTSGLAQPQAVIIDPTTGNVDTLTVSDWPDGQQSIVRRNTAGQIDLSYGALGWQNSYAIPAQYLIDNRYTKAPLNSEISAFPGTEHLTLIAYLTDSTGDIAKTRNYSLATTASGGSIPLRDANGNITLPSATPELNSNSRLAISMKTAVHYFQQLLFKHHKKLQATGPNGEYLELHWNAYNENGEAENKSGNGTILLEKDDLIETPCSGVYKSATIKATITGIVPDTTNIKFFGTGVDISGGATLIISPDASVDVFAEWPTYASLGYNWTIEDYVTWDG